MITDILERTKKLVWPEIKKYLKDPKYPAQFSLPKKYQKEVDLYWKINREYPERKGKYLRPTLVLLTAEALGLNVKKAIKAAAAMQLSEEWILIHDDIEDNSDERRGKPALHKIYNTGLAINAGDALHAIMWKIVFDLKNPKMFNEFYAMLMRTVLGQGVELYWMKKKQKSITKNDYFFIADSKTAYYSMAGPMMLGATLAKASSDQITKIIKFGLYLGRCFNLVDDILDIEQDKKEGKPTLANTKGEKYTRKLAEEMKQKAKDIFDKDLKFLSKEPARSQLTELTEFILERKY